MKVVASFAPFAALDRYCQQHCRIYRSLNPARPIPSSYESSIKMLYRKNPVSLAFNEALATSFLALIEATLEHFPENIFWDFDGIFAALYMTKNLEKLENLSTTLTELFAGYGANSVVRFAYTHDFIFGFDWARWVAKAPEERRNIGPFDPAFLAYLEQRMGELKSLIAGNDAKYGSLANGKIRNPYGFNRSPPEEAALLEKLAREKGIPVAAWELFPRISWQKDYEKKREAAYRALKSLLPS